MTSERTSRSVSVEGAGLAVAGATDRGTVRRRNEDAWDAAATAGGVVSLVLADGMGGHPGGGEAALAAVDAASGSLRGTVTGALDAAQAVRDACGAADEAVAALRRSIGGNPGTTLVAAIVSPDGEATVANIGDSRAYLIAHGEARALTEDHSWVGEQVREGALQPGAERRHPRRNAITRAVMGEGAQPDVFHAHLDEGATLLLCSDGLWEPLSDSEIAALLGGADLAGCLDALCDAALDAGSADNVTAVAVSRLRYRNRS